MECKSCEISQKKKNLWSHQVSDVDRLAILPWHRPIIIFFPSQPNYYYYFFFLALII